VTARTLRVGDYVRTTHSWAGRYGMNPVQGTIRSITHDVPHRTDVPRRTVEVDLIQPIGDHYRAWFDPDDLEPAETTT
jgi:hypothetical protein